MTNQMSITETTLEQMVEYSFQSVVTKEDGQNTDNPTEAAEEYFSNLEDNINLLKKRQTEVNNALASGELTPEKKEFHIKLSEALENGIKQEEAERKDLLSKYLNNQEYSKTFKTKVVETATILFLLSLDTFHKDLFSSAEDAKKININQRMKEFLFASRNDDAHAYKMRLSYLQSANAEAVTVETMNMMSPAEQNIYQASMGSKVADMDRYDSLREELIEKYSMRFPQYSE